MFGYCNEFSKLLEYGYLFNTEVDTKISDELGIPEKHILLRNYQKIDL